MKKLQVLVDGRWEYVFARCGRSHKVLTTGDKAKALPTNACWGEDDLAYFVRNYPQYSFRLASSRNNRKRIDYMTDVVCFDGGHTEEMYWFYPGGVWDEDKMTKEEALEKYPPASYEWVLR